MRGHGRLSVTPSQLGTGSIAQSGQGRSVTAGCSHLPGPQCAQIRDISTSLSGGPTLILSMCLSLWFQSNAGAVASITGPGTNKQMERCDSVSGRARICSSAALG